MNCTGGGSLTNGGTVSRFPDGERERLQVRRQVRGRDRAPVRGRSSRSRSSGERASDTRFNGTFKVKAKVFKKRNGELVTSAAPGSSAGAPTGRRPWSRPSCRARPRPTCACVEAGPADGPPSRRRCRWPRLALAAPALAADSIRYAGETEDGRTVKLVANQHGAVQRGAITTETDCTTGSTPSAPGSSSARRSTAPARAASRTRAASSRRTTASAAATSTWSRRERESERVLVGELSARDRLPPQRRGVHDLHGREGRLQRQAQGRGLSFRAHCGLAGAGRAERPATVTALFL